MAVRVLLHLEAAIDGGPSIQTAAVVNSGFETDRPEVLLPSPCAEALGLYPRRPPGALEERYDTAGGTTTFWRLPEALRVTIAGSGANPVPADAVVTGTDRELFLNDVLAGDLGIIILNVRTGDWRLARDPPDRVRRTESRQHW